MLVVCVLVGCEKNFMICEILEFWFEFGIFRFGDDVCGSGKY